MKLNTAYLVGWAKGTLAVIGILLLTGLIVLIASFVVPVIVYLCACFPKTAITIGVILVLLLLGWFSANDNGWI